VPQGSPTASSVLSVLAKGRLVELGRELAVAVPGSATKEQQVDPLSRTASLDLSTVIRLLSRDELKQACRAHGLDDSGRSRSELATRLLGRSFEPEALPEPLFAGSPRTSGDLPGPGDIVQVRHRQYLVEEVIARPLLGEATRVRLVCLDDDDQGRRRDVRREPSARPLHRATPAAATATEPGAVRPKKRGGKRAKKPSATAELPREAADD